MGFHKILRDMQAVRDAAAPDDEVEVHVGELAGWIQRIRICPSGGDDTGRIQAALDQLASRDPDEDGIRGALVLAAGTYAISRPIRVRAAGIVLRGAKEGEGEDSDEG